MPAAPPRPEYGTCTPETKSPGGEPTRTFQDTWRNYSRLPRKANAEPAEYGSPGTNDGERIATGGRMPPLSRGASALRADMVPR